jgi:branched-chain amino acid transport system substrate-binding protein
MRPRKHVRALMMAVLAVLVLSACGSGTKSSTSTSSSQPAAATTTAASATPTTAATGTASGSQSGSGQPASGSPVVIYGVAATSGQLQTYPGFEPAMNAAATALNKTGGINGHPIKIAFCDDGSDPNVSASCAHKASDTGAIAVVEHSNFDGANAPIYGQQNLALLSSGGNAGDYTNPANFSIDAGSSGDHVGAPTGLAKLGLHKLAVVAVDVPAATADIPPIQVAAKAAGMSFVGSVLFPVTATNYSSFALKLKQLGADSAMMVTSFAEATGFIKAADQLGLNNVTWVFPGSTTGEPQIAQLPSDAQSKIFVVSDWPPFRATNLAAVKQFNAEMAASGAAANNPAPLQVDFAAWMSVHLIAEVANQIKGPVDNKTFLAQLHNTATVNGLGLFTWHPNKVRQVPSQPRLTNGIVYYEVTDGKQLVLSKALASANIFAAFK